VMCEPSEFTRSPDPRASACAQAAMNLCESKSGRHFAHGGQTLLRARQTRLPTDSLYDRLSRVADALPIFARPVAGQSRTRKLNLRIGRPGHWTQLCLSQKKDYTDSRLFSFFLMESTQLTVCPLRSPT
jgi:hypothetical protein